MTDKTIIDLKSESVEVLRTDVYCEGLMCPEIGTEHMPLKIGNNIIKIWLCKKCAEKMAV